MFQNVPIKIGPSPSVSAFGLGIILGRTAFFWGCPASHVNPEGPILRGGQLSPNLGARSLALKQSPSTFLKTNQVHDAVLARWERERDRELGVRKPRFSMRCSHQTWLPESTLV